MLNFTAKIFGLSHINCQVFSCPRVHFTCNSRGKAGPKNRNNGLDQVSTGSECMLAESFTALPTEQIE